MKHHERLEVLPLVERLDFLLNENLCDCNCQHISNLLYGIRNYHSSADQQHIQVLLITITRIIERCTSSIPTAQNVGNSLLGLSGYPSANDTVRFTIHYFFYTYHSFTVSIIMIYEIMHILDLYYDL